MHSTGLDLPTASYLVPHAELRRRVAAFQAHLRRLDCGAALVTHPVDVLYLAGGIVAGWLVVPADDAPVLHVRRGAARAELETCWQVSTTVSTSAIARAAASAAASTGAAGAPARIGLALDGVTAADYTKLLAAWDGAAPPLDITDAIRTVRAVKSEWELQWVRAAAAQSRAAIEHVAAIAEPGMREIDLFVEAEIALRRAGHQGPMRMRRHGGEMFFGQVAAGANAALPAALDAPLGGSGLYPSVGKGASERTVQAGELLVVDVMGCANGYLSDCTRVVAVGGVDAVADDLLAAQQWCASVLEQLEAAARPGVVAQSLHELALELAREAGCADGFMGVSPDQARFVGHGIGLEVDEYPFLARGFDTVLEPGMVFAVEPKIVFAGRAAVGIEDSFIVSQAGVECLESPDRTVL